jgi:hypothetical protein
MDDDVAFSIASCQSDRQLVFVARVGDCFELELRSHALSAGLRIWGYADGDRLVEMFEAMAKATSGWEGTKQWSSIEGEFSLAAQCDKLGHVSFDVSLRHSDGREPWQVKTCLQTELGQLPALAWKAKRFFAQ